MKYSTKTRIKSAALAVLMLLTSVPVSALTAVKAEAAEVTISFAQQEDPQVAYVITGGTNSVTVIESLPSGYTSYGLKLRHTTDDYVPIEYELTNVKDGSDTGTLDNGVAISDRTANGTRTIKFGSKFDPFAEDADAAAAKVKEPEERGVATYSIYGLYRAALVTGSVYVSNSTAGKENSGTATFTGTLAVSDFSRMVLVSDGLETDGGMPSFHVKGIGNDTGNSADAPVGAFKQYTDTPTNPGESSGVRARRNGETITFEVYSGNYVIYIDIDANLYYTTKTDEYGNELGADGNPASSTNPAEPDDRNYYIRNGTEFEIIYRMPTTETKYIRVMTPQSAIENIETQINSKETEPDYIKLATGDDFSYITADFDLRYTLTQYNADFHIEWEWEPTRVLKNNKWVDLVEDDEEGEEKKSDYMDVVQVTQNFDVWRQAHITPREDNVEGNLVAKVSYVSGSSSQPTNTVALGGTLPTKVLTIRGTGKEATVGVGNRIFGAEDKEDDPTFKSIAANVLETFDMDAYRGGLDSDGSFTVTSEHPYQYDIKMTMGEKNGAARYAVAEMRVLSGSADAVTLQSREGTTGAFYDYTPGSNIANPLYGLGDNTTQGESTLRVIATPFAETGATSTQRIQLTIKFYLAGRDASSVTESPDVYQIQFNITDSTPSQDSSLESLRFIDVDTGQAIPFAFDPGNLTYTTPELTVHIPYKTRSITMTAVQKDIRARDNKMSFYILSGTTYSPEEGMYTGENEAGPEDTHPVYSLTSGSASKEIHFYSDDQGGSDAKSSPYINRPYDIVLTVPCQDPRSQYWSEYRVTIIRDLPSTDNTLGSLSIFAEGDDRMENNLLADFDPNQTDYELWIPYSTQMLQIRAEKNDPQATFNLSDMVVLKGEKDTGDNIYYEPAPNGGAGNGPAYGLEGRNSPTDPHVWLKQIKQHFEAEVMRDADGVMTLKFTVTSEEGEVDWSDYVPADPPGSDVQRPGQRYYYVHLKRLPADKDPSMGELVVTDNDENVQTYTPAFNPDNSVYTLEIPYAVRQIKFNVTPNNENVYKIEIWEGEIDLEKNATEVKKLGTDAKLVAKYTSGIGLTAQEEDDGVVALRPGVLTKGIKVKARGDKFVEDHGGVHPFYIVIWAEDSNYATYYNLRVRRAEPSNDAALTDLLLKDGANQEIKTFLFHPDQFGCGNDSYHVTVPYSTKQISFTPTTSHQYATVEIRDGNFNTIPSWGDYTGQLYPYLVESGATSRLFNLDADWGKEKEFHVIVRAEDYEVINEPGVPVQETGHWRVYCIKIARDAPSDDARLKSLTTQNTSKLKPQFISSKTDYTADVNEGAPGVILTPTANHPGATIQVDGVVVQSGSPTDLIELLEIQQTVYIEVTAEDGVTKMVYKVTFTNQNLIEKTSNADLKNLTVNYGLMTPNFQAAVLDYEVTTKENAWSVDIIPRLADPYATMRVLNGTLELGDYNGNYAMAIVDGLNEVSIEVTSPDKTVTKTYNVDIYRNDEEKLKNWKPLEAEDINFEQVSNPIIVKIEEYPRVGASVFNTIREEHPEMSIVFQGNDYSIRFDGANLTRVIPQTEIYDFQMSLTSPDEDAIYDLVAEYDYNNDIISDIVMLYFDYHGSLPGPATFSLSLGRHYANDLLYWHYYNKERDRIDYYGALQSNSQGNIAVSIDHFSTYIVSPEHRIAGSEDKDGVVDELGMVSNGQDLLGSGGKLNPDTGVTAVTAGAAGEAAEARALPSFGQRPDLYIRKKETP